MIFPILSLIAQAQEGNLGGPFTTISGYNQFGDADVATGQLELLVSNILGFLTIAAGISFLIYFGLGGLTWITAGGDKGKVEEAKSRMTNGAIGMIIIVATWSIVWIIGQVLGFDLINLKKTIPKIAPQSQESSNTYEPSNYGAGGSFSKPQNNVPQKLLE